LLFISIFKKKHVQQTTMTEEEMGLSKKDCRNEHKGYGGNRLMKELMKEFHFERLTFDRGFCT